jgi:hypothetical protein
MTRFAAAAVGFVVVCTLLTAIAPAQDHEGLIPAFDGDKQPGSSRTGSKEGSAVGKMLDSLHPKHAMQATRSTFRKLNNGTKRMMSQTMGMLTPWKREAKRTPGFLAKNDRQKKTSFFSSWLRRKENKTPPPTLSEWIGRPRP